MDAKRFDLLARTLSADGSRRGALQLLGTLPLFGWLAFFLNDDGAAKRRKKRNAKGGKGRGSDRQDVGAANHKHEHRRRKHRNKRNNDHKDKPKKPCKPESTAQTCDGQCGQVKNNCKKSIDCGSCACDPSCAACQVCNATSGQCQADPAQDDESCGGCRICDNGNCITDETIVCTASDQCHEAGGCDPETGECTNPAKEDGTACDDGDPCTTNDTCQQGECRGASRDCSAASDVCNDGVCRNDGTCGKRPKADGTGCNADNTSCTAGDSCQNGVCTPGAGVDCSHQNDECNRGVCRQVDGACVKDPREDGTPCGTNGQCANGICEEVACLALRESCSPSDNQCCGEAGCAETLPNCNEPGDRCCLETRETCGHDCECCGLSFCEDNTCCSHTGNTCQTAQDCCQNALNQQDCVNNRCCALPDEPCEGPNDCCEGLCDPEDSVCTSCLGLQRSCEDESQCCQRQGPTECAFSFDFNDTNCCRPAGGICEVDNDCCDQRACVNGFCCTPSGETCPSSGECCPGLGCDDRFGINQCGCKFNGFYCDGIEDSLTVCCAGAGTCQFWPPEPGRKRCCHPDGTPCDSRLTFDHLGCCGGFCSTASGTCSSTCTPIGGECGHHLECCGVLQFCDGIDPETRTGHCV